MKNWRTVHKRINFTGCKLYHKKTTKSWNLRHAKMCFFCFTYRLQNAFLLQNLQGPLRITTRSVKYWVAFHLLHSMNPSLKHTNLLGPQHAPPSPVKRMFTPPTYILMPSLTTSTLPWTHCLPCLKYLPSSPSSFSPSLCAPSGKVFFKKY